MASLKIQNGKQSDHGPFEFEGQVSHMHLLMNWLAHEHPEKVILSYPNIRGEYDVNLTGSDMERLTAFSASKYSEAFKQVPGGEVTGDIGFGGLGTKIVAMVNVSTLSSYITLIALQRLGFSTMLISPRLAESGYAHLLRVVGAHTVIAGATSIEMMHRVKKTYEGPLDIFPMLNDNETLAGLDSPYVELPDPGSSPGTIIQYVPSGTELILRQPCLEASSVGSRACEA